MKWTFKDWYKVNRAELNKKRRKKYATDPVYRKAAQDSVKKSRVSAMKKREELKANTYSMAEVGKLVGRSPQTIKIWEDKGYIPAVASKGKVRRYTLHMVQLIALIAEALNKENDVPVSVIQQVKEYWDYGG